MKFCTRASLDAVAFQYWVEGLLAHADTDATARAKHMAADVNRCVTGQQGTSRGGEGRKVTQEGERSTLNSCPQNKAALPLCVHTALVDPTIVGLWKKSP